MKLRGMRQTGHVACMGDKSGAYRVLIRKPEGKRPLGRHGRRWQNSIKMDLQEGDGEAWTGLIWLRLEKVAGTCECGNDIRGP
jgi:hypothetical protein